MIRNLFRRKTQEPLAPVVHVPHHSSVLVVGDNAGQREQMFREMLIPQAVSAGQSLFLVRESESQWVADEIKARISNPKLASHIKFIDSGTHMDEHDIEGARDFVSLVICYPDDYLSSEKSSLWKTLMTAVALEYMDQMTDFDNAEQAESDASKDLRKSFFIGDLDRLDSTLMDNLATKIAQLRALGFQMTAQICAIDEQAYENLRRLVANVSCCVFVDSRDFSNLQNYKLILDLSYIGNDVEDEIVLHEMRTLEGFPAVNLVGPESTAPVIKASFS